MIFCGSPGLVVIDRKTVNVLFKFDEQGEYETDDPALIARLAPRFKAKGDERPAAKQPTKKAVKKSGKR